MRFLAVLLLTVLLFPAMSTAQNGFGLGIVLGDPTGISGKYVAGGDQAIDAALAFSSDSFYIHGTWLLLQPSFFKIDAYPVSWYYGVGPRIISHDHSPNNRRAHFGNNHEENEDDIHLAARAPIGLNMYFDTPHIEVFVEVALALDIVPETSADLDFGIGARYYF